MAKSGWFKESARHSLAAKGVPTGRKTDYYSTYGYSGNWKKIEKTNAIARWDKGTLVVLVQEIKGNKYEAMYSDSVGGWYSLGVFIEKQKALDSAIDFMKMKR
jgi:hypothetical protein